MDAARIVMTANSRLDRRSLGWKRRSGRRRSRDGQVQDLIGAEHPWTRQECPRSADIEGLGEIEKLLSGRVYASNKHWNLNVNSGRASALSGGKAHAFSLMTRVWEHIFPALRGSTSGLVLHLSSTRIAIIQREVESSYIADNIILNFDEGPGKFFFHKRISNCGYHFSLYVQNRTHLPLTVTPSFDSIRLVSADKPQRFKWHPSLT